MRRFRLLSIVILLVFSFNSVASCNTQNIPISPNVNLAASSSFDDITGIENKDVGRIKMALGAEISRISEDLFANSSVAISVALGKLWGRGRVKEKIEDNTIYQPSDIQIFFKEVDFNIIPAYACLKCRVKDDYGERTYYAIFDLDFRREGLPYIEIYTKDVFDKHKKDIKINDDLTVPEAANPEAVNRYIEHEQLIDETIAYAHKNDLVGKSIFFNYKKTILRLLDKINVKVTTPPRLKPMEEREFYFIPYTEEIRDKLSKIEVFFLDSDNKIFVVPQAHSSNNAVHIFLPEEDYSVFTDVNSTYPLLENGTEDNTIQKIIETVEDILAHEIGVMIGYVPVYELSDSIPQNHIDERWAKVKEDTIVEPLEEKIIDLNKKLEIRDYVAGEKTETNPNYSLLDNIPTYEDLKNIDLSGKRVLVRVNLNVKTLEGELQDTTRVDNTLKIIRFLMEKDATPILFGHNGRLNKKKNIDDRESLEHVAEYIKSMLAGEHQVIFHPDSIDEKGLQITKEEITAGNIHVLQNMRFAVDFETGEKKAEFSKALIALTDGIVDPNDPGIYISDKFGDSGSSGASVEELPLLASNVYMGPEELNEFNEIRRILEEGFDCLIFGGIKVEKVDILPGLMKGMKSDGFILSGSGPTAILRDERKKLLEKINRENPGSLLLAKGYRDPNNTDDIDDATIAYYIKKLDTLKKGETVVVNGTMGFMEHKDSEGRLTGIYARGTDSLWQKLKDLALLRGVNVVIVGGDAGSMIKRYDFPEELPNVTKFSGGGVPLKIFARNPLKGLKALNKKQESISNEILDLAETVGRELPTHPNDQYNLLVPFDFFAGDELDLNQEEFLDRFELSAVGGEDNHQFVENILAKSEGKENKSIALVPDDLTKEELDRILDAGIRFVRMSSLELLEAKSLDKKERQTFQRDTYAIMLLTRALDKDEESDSSIYRLLYHYINTHFNFKDNVYISEYIDALKKGTVEMLIKGVLMLRPIIHYKMPEYHEISQVLLSA